VGQKTSTIYIKWVRSGIALPRSQRRIVGSLGLQRVNQVVERPDTPNVRGVVAKVPHLLQVVPAPVAPAWAAVPEYVITARVALPKPPKAKAEVKAAGEALKEKVVQQPRAEAKAEKPEAAKAETPAPRKKTEGAKKAASAPAKQPSAKSEGEKPRKRKAAESKESKSEKKGKK
jgi:large subunit ribosomal protein L30